jgi:hypothetical protein
MLDQMFTAENFRRIYDAENRKGIDLASRYFPSLGRHTLAIRDKVREIRQHRSFKTSMATGAFETRLLELKEELKALKAAKSTVVDSLMDDVSQRVLEQDLKINLSQKTGPKGKPVFCIDATPETFFVIKQLQRNVHLIYSVKQANRHDLVCQLRDVIDNSFPFEIVRTDISTFYESIDRRILIEKLDRDQLLSPSSKKYIKQVLDSYGVISSTPTGIPRGVGISAYLAEIYLRPVDKAIQEIPGIVLYCRFVDDIVAVFARPPSGKNLGSFKDLIIAILKGHGLTHNGTKTSEYALSDSKIQKFEYLGYQFTLKAKNLEISPSAAKIEKYRERMKLAFAAYLKEKSLNSRHSFRNLVARIKFLTGNTRLSNSKSRSATGIYYNNSIVTDMTSFTELDKELNGLVDSIKSLKLKKRLRTLKFTTGFEERRYHYFKGKELKTIVRAWKHV